MVNLIDELWEVLTIVGQVTLIIILLCILTGVIKSIFKDVFKK